MIHSQSTKKTFIIAPMLTTAGQAQTATVVDCGGYRYATIEVQISTAATSAGSDITVLSLVESDDTNASNNANVTTFVGGTAVGTNVGFVIPSNSTAVGRIVSFNVDLRRRKRYLGLAVTTPVATKIAALAVLSRPEQSPVGTTAQGVDVIVNG